MNREPAERESIPLLRVAVLALAAGDAAALALSPRGAAAPLVAAALALFASAAIAYARPPFAGAAAALAFSAAGFALGAPVASAAIERHERWARFDEKLVRLEGTVATPPREIPSPHFFRSPPGANGGARAFELAIDPGRERERVRVLVDEPPEGSVRRGDRVRVRGWLAPLRAPTNPGEEDRRPAAFRAGRVADLRAGSGGNVEILERGAHPFTLLDAARDRARHSTLRAAPGNGGALLLALFLGDWRAVPRDTSEALRETGTIHLLAVSGVHVLLLVRALRIVLDRLPLREGARRAIVLSFLGAYAALVGFAPPVARAAVMAGAGEAAAALGRRLVPVDSLALAGLAILAVDPAALLDPGAELSFAAVLALVLLAPRIESALPLPRLVAGPLALSIAATLATAPILAARFHLVSPGSVIANLFASPVVSVILVAGAPALLVSAVAENPVTDGVLNGLGFAFDLLVDGLSLFARVPGVALPIPPPPAVALALSACALALATAASSPRRLAPLLAISILATGSGLFLPATDRPARARLTVLDVGQGAAAILETRGGFLAALDCGSTSRPDAAARVVAPFLAWRGSMRLDAAVLSHPDADHVNATPWLARRRMLDEVMGSEAVAAQGIAGARPLVAGDVFECGDGVRIRVLHPARGHVAPPGTPPARARNDASLALLVESDGGCVLLPGDLQDAGLEALLASGADLRAEVLLMPHHGSFAEPLGEFLRRVGPAVAIASARTGFVPEATRAELAARGIPLLETSACGAVEIELDAVNGGARARAIGRGAR